MVSGEGDRHPEPEFIRQTIPKGDIMSVAKNVLGEALELCCTSPLTGFYRDGFCVTGPEDAGTHVICAQVTEEFLSFTRSRGNDLSTPAPHLNFPGLKPGDRWCLCATRWREALEAGKAPPVILTATHEAALKYVSREDLKEHALTED
jgi:uncharacterized protein (DUF2237 family)